MIAMAMGELEMDGDVDMDGDLDLEIESRLPLPSGPALRSWWREVAAKTGAEKKYRIA